MPPLPSNLLPHRAVSHRATMPQAGLRRVRLQAKPAPARAYHYSGGTRTGSCRGQCNQRNTYAALHRMASLIRPSASANASRPPSPGSGLYTTRRTRHIRAQAQPRRCRINPVMLFRHVQAETRQALGYRRFTTLPTFDPTDPSRARPPVICDDGEIRKYQTDGYPATATEPTRL